MRFSILYVGAREGTCLQRARALSELGHRVVHIEAGIPGVTDWRYQLYRLLSRVGPAPDVFRSNRRMIHAARRRGFDLVWVDKGLSIHSRTLSKARGLLPGARFVSYSPDDMLNPQNQSPRYLESIPIYDLHVTTKSYNVSELRALGARDVLFIDNAYDPAMHRPMELTEDDRRRFGAEVGFVGFYEEERAAMMLQLAEAGIPVTVRGPAWSRFSGAHPNLKVQDMFLADLDYTKAVNATRINLGFLRKINRDLQTTRSVEIPACGAFMLAERTDEHQRLFQEGVEAEFFSDPEEMIRKCRYYLEHEDERRQIASAGLRRCIQAGYSNQARLAAVLDALSRPSAGATSAEVESP